MYFIRDVQCIDGIAVNSQFAIGKIHADIINELVAFHFADGRCASCGECFDSDAELRVILVVQLFVSKIVLYKNQFFENLMTLQDAIMNGKAVLPIGFKVNPVPECGSCQWSIRTLVDSCCLLKQQFLRCFVFRYRIVNFTLAQYFRKCFDGKLPKITQKHPQKPKNAPSR